MYIPALILTAILIIGSIINNHITQSYMDEIFHIPQTQQYCLGNLYSWNNKITTLPGTYIAASVYGFTVLGNLNLFSFMSNIVDTQNIQENVPSWCTIASLRSFNWISWFGLTWVLVHYFQRRLMFRNKTFSWLFGLEIATWPPLFFYTFLFYTDTLSTLCLVACWSIALSHKQSNSSYKDAWVISLLGAYATFVRQTNIVWVLCSGLIVLQKRALSFDTSITLKQKIYGFLHSICTSLDLICTVIPLLLLAVGFVFFVYWNGGIVVGDKAHHEIMFHGAQFVYLVLLLGMYTWIRVSIAWCLDSLYYLKFQAWLTQLRFKLRSNFSLLFCFRVMILSGLFSYIMMYHAYTHPFLLADNRHYMFYIMKRTIFRYQSAAVVAGISASIFFFLVWNRMRHNRMNTIDTKKQKNNIWILSPRVLWLCASILTLVPTHLVEFRYFTPSIVIFLMLNSVKHDRAMLESVVGLCTNMCINIVTLYIFVFRPFQWSDGTIARFVW